MMKKRQIRWGIIGCGAVTEVKSGPALQKVSESFLVAVMRRNGEKAKDYAERHGVSTWYTDAQKLIDDPKVDAVYIATPPDTHAYYTKLLAKAGKPVYVEKPMARTYAECLEMIEACEQANVPLFVAYYRRALPYFLHIKKLLDEKAIGEILTVNIRLFHANTMVKAQDGSMPWRVTPAIAGGGLFFDLGSHQLDLLDDYFGPIDYAQGLAANQVGNYEAEDAVVANFSFESGVMGSGIWCFHAAEDCHTDECEIIGSKGRICFSFFDPSPIRLQKDGREETFLIDHPQHVQQPLIQWVVDDLLGRGKCPSTGISGARASQWLEQIALGQNK